MATGPRARAPGDRRAMDRFDATGARRGRPSRARAIARAVLASVAVAAWRARACEGLEVRVRAGETECVTERVREDESSITGSWFVVRSSESEGGGWRGRWPTYGDEYDDYAYWDGREDAFDARATMEFGEEREEVYNALGKSEHRFEYGLRKAGTIRTCFKNSGTRDAGVRYSASIGHRWDHEKATVKHIDPTYERLNNVEAEVSKLMQEVRYHKTRATRAMHTVKSVNARVLRWSLIEAVVMVCASIYQFYHVQTLFMNRDRRGTMRV